MRRAMSGWSVLGAVALVVTAAGCGSSGGGGASDTAASVTAAPATAAASSETEPTSGSEIYLRPVLQCAAATPATDDTSVTTAGAPGGPNATEVLPLQPGGSCLVGPQRGTRAVFESNASAEIIGGGWGVTVSLRSGVDGEDVWNAVAAECYSGTPVCPSRQLAIEVEGVIVSAPTVNAPSFSGNVQISGAFTQAEAASLAALINAPAGG